MPYADLHIHTTNSDGVLELTDIPDRAREAGVEVVAITDHDGVHPDLSQPISTIDGITVISGIELRTELPNGERVDLLGYGVEPTDDLQTELNRVRENRINRAQEIVNRVEDRLDVTLDIDIHDRVGRPHIARAIDDHPDIEYDYNGAFNGLIGDDPCYASRDVTPVEEGIGLLTESCDCMALAHPYRYDDPETALELCQHLDAVERHYPYGRDVDATLVDAAIDEYDLTPTGGSDAHEETLGKAGLSKDDYQSFRESL